MTYAPAHRPFYDADSHIMELPDFLRDHADADLRALFAALRAAGHDVILSAPCSDRRGRSAPLGSAAAATNLMLTHRSIRG